MSTLGTISQLIGRLKAHPDQEAAQRIYERYIERLVGLARSRLGAGPHRVADEEDVAHAAIRSLFEGISQGRFPRLSDRDDLWQILGMLVRRKAIDARRREARNHLVGESILGRGPDPACGLRNLEQVAEQAPTPEDAIEFEEELRRRLGQLPKPHYRQVVLWKMEGRSSEEIAEMLGCTTRSVERYLVTIRLLWTQA
jgi:RNA polymerase sigma factor (sigma-70 family)